MLSPWQAIWEVFASCELCSRSASRDGLRVQASISQAKESDITDKGYSKTQKLPSSLLCDYYSITPEFRSLHGPSSR